MDEQSDNTLLWVLLGAAVVYFFMKQSGGAGLSQAIAAAGGPSGASSSTAVTFNPSAQSITVNLPQPSVNPIVTDTSPPSALDYTESVLPFFGV